MTRLAPIVALAIAAACARSASVGSPAGSSPSRGVGPEATAVMHDASGRTLGTLTLVDGSQGIIVSGRLTGLPPGQHALHLHAVGRCDAPAFTTAGGHWNPTGREHGTMNPNGPHFGDLPTITVGSDSAVTITSATPGGTLRGTNALLDADGAAVVIHAVADDNRTNPAGNAGARIACGVVTAR